MISAAYIKPSNEGRLIFVLIFLAVVAWLCFAWLSAPEIFQRELRFPNEAQGYLTVGRWYLGFLQQEPQARELAVCPWGYAVLFAFLDRLGDEAIFVLQVIFWLSSVYMIYYFLKWIEVSLAWRVAFSMIFVVLVGPLALSFVALPETYSFWLILLAAFFVHKAEKIDDSPTSALVALFLICLAAVTNSQLILVLVVMTCFSAVRLAKSPMFLPLILVALSPLVVQFNLSKDRFDVGYPQLATNIHLFEDFSTRLDHKTHNLPIEDLVAARRSHVQDFLSRNKAPELVSEIQTNLFAKLLNDPLTFILEIIRGMALNSSIPSLYIPDGPAYRRYFVLLSVVQNIILSTLGIFLSVIALSKFIPRWLKMMLTSGVFVNDLTHGDVTEAFIAFTVFSYMFSSAFSAMHGDQFSSFTYGLIILLLGFRYGRKT